MGTRTGRLAMVLIGVAFYETLHSLGLINESVNLGLISAALIVGIHQLFEILHRLEKEDLLARKVQNFTVHNNNTTGKMLESIYREMMGSIEVEDDRFQAKHELLAIPSYIKFWKLLTEEQAARGKTQCLQVLALHTGPIDPWTSDPTGKLFEVLQRRFVENGGNIKRIFCGKGEQWSQEINEAAERMRFADIFYYDINSNAVDHNFAWDFCTVKDTKATVVWTGFSQASIIERAIYGQTGFFQDGSRFIDLSDRWKQFRETCRIIHEVPQKKTPDQATNQSQVPTLPGTPSLV